MARYKHYDYNQHKLIPISFADQILPGSFEYTLNYLIDHEVDLSVCEARYCRGMTYLANLDPDTVLSTNRRATRHSRKGHGSRKGRALPQPESRMVLTAGSCFRLARRFKSVPDRHTDGLTAGLFQFAAHLREVAADGRRHPLAIGKRVEEGKPALDITLANFGAPVGDELRYTFDE